ncbi:MAG: hypothetical protein JWM10_1615 [Myxococcaceae bacterium]|nr:hypothetical protein [Myxococcaceae bacterium]
MHARPTRRALLTAALLARSAAAQSNVPAIADPYTAHLVEGRVVLADGRPAAGVVVERAGSADGRTPYSAGAYRDTTDARGAFRFSFHGLGMSTGLTWHLAARRPGCRGAVVTVTLTRAPLPPSGWEGDVRTGVLIRLPRCAADRAG